MATNPSDSLGSVTVNSTFMQDYVAVTPLLPDSGGAYPAVCVDRSGAIHVFYATLNTPTLWHARPDPDSMTGWRADVQAILPVFAVLASADGLFLFGLDNVLRAARFNADGSLGDFAELGASGWPTEPGWAPDLYCLENDNETQTFWARNLDSGVRIPLVFDVALERQFPMLLHGSVQQETLRMVVQTGAANGLSTWLAAIATRRPDGSAFDVATGPEPIFPPLPVLDSVFILEHGPGDVELVHMPGIDQPIVDSQVAIQTRRGRFDPGGSGPVQWDAPASGTLPAVRPLIRMVGSGEPNGDALQLFWYDQGRPGVGWQSTRPTPGDAWDEPGILDNVGIRPMLPGEDLTFLAQRQIGGLAQPEIWRRNDDGDYDIDIVELEGDPASPIEVPSYRVELRFAQGGVSLAGVDVSIGASVETRATVNGERMMLGPARPRTFQTDANGTIWVMLAVDERLSVARLVVECVEIGRPFEVEVDGTMRTYMTNITADQMANAADPRTSPPTPVLKDPSTAPDCAAAIGAAMKAVNTLAAASRPAAAATPPGWSLAGNAAARWIAPGPAAPAAAADLLAPLGAWCVEDVGGQPRFRTLGPDEAAAKRTAMAAMPAWPRPENMFGDFWDALGDLGRSVWDGVTHIGEILVDGAEMTLRIIGEGFDYVYHFVIDSWDRAWDAVTFVLDKFGRGLGYALGWMLEEQFGLIFDWGEVGAMRDQIKAAFRNGLSQIPVAIADPATGAQTLLADLDSWRQQFDGWIAQFRTSPVDHTSFGNQATSDLQPLLGFLTVNSGISAQVTWLLEKAYDAIAGNLGFPPSPSIAGLGDASAALDQALMGVLPTLMPGVDDLATLFEGWFVNGDLFSSSAFDPLLTVVQRHGDAFFDSLGQVTTAGGGVLHLLWANPGAVADWLDTPIDLPFFSAFYEGLTDGTLSPLDLLCLAAALPASALENRTAMDAGPAWYLGVCVSGVGSLVRGFAQAAMAKTDTKDSGMIGRVSIGCTIVAGALALSHGSSARAANPLITPKEEARIVGLLLLFGAIPDIYAAARSDPKGAAKQFASFVSLCFMLAKMAGANDYMKAYYCLQITSNMAEAFVQLAEGKLDPETAIIYGVCQGVLSAACTGLLYGSTYGSRIDQEVGPSPAETLPA